MSVIIRLQNLPWSANALDIRQYFTGLSIPEGGVHIVGGEQGDAFIAFSTDEDARQAFQRNNGKIKEIQITLSLSSRTEMQRVIEAARTQSYAAFMPSQPTVPLPAAIPIIPAAVPELRIDLSKDKSDKREKKRSRSRDRKDRSRERDRRDRRYRDRSRSRSRDRRDSRRRRDGSRSRGRSRSRDRDRKSRDRKRSEEQNTTGFIPKKTIEPWTQNDTIPPAPQPPILIGFGGVDIPRRNVNNLDPLASGNGFNPNIVGNRGRESWPPNNMPNQNQNFNSRVSDESFKKDGRPNFGNNRQVSTFPDRGNQRNVFQRNNRLQESPGKPDSRQQAPNCCVKVEPFYGAYADVRRFFQGCFISSTGIKFINDFGTGSGIVYVQFCQQKAKFDALFRNNEIFNGVTVSVTHIDDSEFEKAVDKYLPDFNDHDDDHRNKFGGNKFKNIPKFYNKPEIRLKMFTSLTVEDLPTYVKEQDILKMFSLYPLTSIILTNKGRGGHIAYVKFSSADDAKKALEEKSQHIVENKPVTVRPCKDEDFDAINKQNELNINTKSVKKSGSDCVSVSGLPLKTSDRDISDFFSDIGVIPVKINLISNQMGFTGQAYCEFANEDESETALKKDTCVIGTQVVNVKPIPRSEMQSLLNETELGLADIVSQLPPKLPPSSLLRQENMNSFRPMLNRGMGPNQNRLPHFMPRGNFDQGPRGRGGFMPGRGGPPRQHFNQFGPNSGGGFAEDVPPGCTVFMDNIPYKAGTNEILDFFEGYNVTNNVSRRFDLNNTPTAEAKVVFRTQEDAFIAVKEKHMQNIWDRTIYLQQV